MTNKTKTNAPLSRRKILTRTGLLAAAAYTVPAFTTLSMAQAGSGASGGGNSNGGGGSSNTSAASTPSAASGATATGGVDNSAEALRLCGTENLDDSVYLQCLIDNGLNVI